ncbi:MAG: hypothetical protein WCK73_17945 [Deltaproteobacteria bacterium]
MAKVGGEVDAFCTRCQLLLAHTVIAMIGAVPVKVECNTCRTVHRFRGASTTPARTSRPRQPAVSFEEMLATRTSPARRYAITDFFAKDDVVDHPTFGRGFVSEVKVPGKVEVTFRGGVKTLVHGRH